MRKVGDARKNQRHGMSSHPAYGSWSGAIQRCYNVRSNSFANYGARGIGVCPEWHDFPTFARWADTSGYERGLTLERIDPDKGYSPANCRWIPRSEQPKNRRTNRYIEFRGRRMTSAEAARQHGLSRQLVCLRLSNGWSVEEALCTRPGEQRQKGKL